VTFRAGRELAVRLLLAPQRDAAFPTAHDSVIPNPISSFAQSPGSAILPPVAARVQEREHLQEPVLSLARRDYSTLRPDQTVGEALDSIRKRGLGERIVYFYVVDDSDRLMGVLPTRQLLTAPLDKRLADIMIRRVVTIPIEATVLDACEYFVLHKFLAFPVVDGERRIRGIVDVNQFTEEVFDIAEREQMDEVFESIGFRVSEVRDASPFRAFRFRSPWLAATIASGTICALLVGVFEATLLEMVVLAFFLTLVLGLGESVSIQAMTVTIQALRARRPSWGWYGRSMLRETGTTLLLGLACGFVVAVVAWVWRGDSIPAVVIGGSIVLALGAAGVFGLTVPTLLHALRLDPKIAAGPVTLALADIATVLIYFSLATLALRL
jgi:magnesium transporter